MTASTMKTGGAMNIMVSAVTAAQNVGEMGLFYQEMT